MKEYKTIAKRVETKEITYVSSRTCDICQKQYRNDWNKDCYEVAETEVRYKEGSSYPEGGNGTETTIDICPRCFVDELIPWVKSRSGTPTVKDWDW